LNPKRLFSLLSSIEANFFLEEEVEGEFLLAGFSRRGSRDLLLMREIE
jgi:hypothetical protein